MPKIDKEVEQVSSEGVKIETYRREDGWWSFRINGQESAYRSSNEMGLNRTVKALLFGLPTGTITLKVVKAEFGGGQIGKNATTQIDDKATWQTLPTQQERISAFLSRGKLGMKEVR